MQLSELSERSRGIFREIVESYLDTGVPVGSGTLSRKKNIDISSATIRHVMADLEQAGLLSSPHVSAGRFPTDTGLRLFVDAMLEVGNLTRAEREAIRGNGLKAGKTMEDMLAETTKVLSGLSKCASLVMVPKESMTVRQIAFILLSPKKALVVIVSEQGMVENRIIELPEGTTQTELIQAGNYLNTKLSGKTLEEVVLEISSELAKQKHELDSLTTKVIDAGLAVWSEENDSTSLIISGQANLLENVEAQEDLERIRKLFEELDKKSELIHLLEFAQNGKGVKLFIGSENNLFSLSGSSLVVSPYMNGTNKIIGVVGVIGPIRLNYARIIPMVNYTARIVSRLYENM